MSSVSRLVADAAQVLSDAGVASPRVDAELLLAYVLGVEPGEVRRRAILGAPVSDGERARFEEVTARRAAREPLHHLTGVAHFRHLDLAVGPGVFIPRPETEQVAQVAIDEAARLIGASEIIRKRTAAAVDHDVSVDRSAPIDRNVVVDASPEGSLSPVVVVDLCTGSGAIALAVATEVPSSVVHAVELDARAHEWAARNIAGVSGTSSAPEADRGAAPLVRLVRGDARTALRELDGTVDVVVSNPPYVPPDAVPRDPEVAGYDPGVALYGLGADGLEVPRGIAAAAARLLRPGGLFVMEHAEVQAAAARSMVDGTAAFRPATTREDLTGRPRMVVARRASQDESASGS